MNLFSILIIRLLCIFVLTSCSYCPIFKTKIKVFFEIAKRLFYCSATLRLYMSLCLSLSHLLIQHSIMIYNFLDNFEKFEKLLCVFFVLLLGFCWLFSFFSCTPLHNQQNRHRKTLSEYAVRGVFNWFCK